ncbi:hypothetical protein IQ07DRAFT_603332 [Pyrenochaeta sp. DS3sAY3a]|nr:hypothetical protein IQ07DRAFT_603332 [Pyrenochaeta sp. DS3sAY3a]
MDSSSSTTTSTTDAVLHTTSRIEHISPSVYKIVHEIWIRYSALPLATTLDAPLIPGALVPAVSHDAPPPYVETADPIESGGLDEADEQAADGADADGSEASDDSDSNDETEPDSVNGEEDVVDPLIQALLCLPSRISPTATFRK